MPLGNLDPHHCCKNYGEQSFQHGLGTVNETLYELVLGLEPWNELGHQVNKRELVEMGRQVWQIRWCS